MGVKLKNNAVSTIAAAISSSDVGVSVAAGTGTLFPTLGGSDYFYATLVSTAGTYEIVKVTARTDDAMTLVRGQEGTTAQSFASGSRFEARVTAASVADLVAEYNEASEISFTPTGGIAATNVQTAIAEVDSEKASLTALSASGGSALVGYLQAGAGAAARTVQAKLRDRVSVKDFGAVGDGVADDTTAIQACLTYCATTGAVAYVPTGSYSIDTLSVADGIGGIYCDGLLVSQGTAPTATIVLGGVGAGVTYAYFRLRMDQNNGDVVAVRGYDTSYCTFADGLFYGFPNDVAANHYAYQLSGPCKFNTFSGNNITLYDAPTMRGFGISLFGDLGTVDGLGGFGTGAVVRSPTPALGNTITGNIIQYGSYSIQLQQAEYNTVAGNYSYKTNHRSVYIAASWGNAVVGNVFREYTSTAVLLAYGASHNVVSGNYCETTVISGEATMNINTGSTYNLIEANNIYAASNYGVYVATDAINNTIIGNDIGNHYLAAIAVENDWIVPRPTNAVFSRPNYEVPGTIGLAAYSFVDMTGIVIKNNVIRAGYTGRNTAAIYVAQITDLGNTKTSNITIDGNSVVSADNISYNVYIFEETAGFLTDLRITNNDFHSGNTEISASTASLAAGWSDKVTFFSNNKELDEVLVDEAYTFTDADTTPSVVQNAGVANLRLFEFANTGATSVTMFDGGFDGQQITVRLDANTTIVHDNAKIRAKGSANITGSASSLVSFRQISGIWFEIWRNF